MVLPSWVISYCIRAPLKVTTDGTKEPEAIHPGMGQRLNKTTGLGRGEVEQFIRQSFILWKIEWCRNFCWLFSHLNKLLWLKTALRTFLPNASGILFRHKNFFWWHTFLKLSFFFSDFCYVATVLGFCFTLNLKLTINHAAENNKAEKVFRLSFNGSFQNTKGWHATWKFEAWILHDQYLSYLC